MKHISRTVIAVVLAILVTTLMPAQVFADSLPEYVGELKVFYGDYTGAEKDGYKIVCGSNGQPVDLNQGAGGGWGSKGEKAVYLGYKTTNDRKDAITDLALMNMKGGYSVQEYDALMEAHMNSQIIPFVDNFLTAIKEYRENLNSDNTENKQRAEYIKSVLNKLTDDDTGKGLGDLLVNETKYEMGDDAYNKLSAEEKKNHADILTIIAQANGKATLLVENLITRAADTGDSSWIDRFVSMSYDDLIDQTGLGPVDAGKELAKLYSDDADLVLEMWETFRSQLLEADKEAEELENTDETDLGELEEKIDALNDNSSTEEFLDIFDAFDKSRNNAVDYLNKVSNVAVAEYLRSIEYGDGTLFDFFTAETDEIYDDITVLYPLIASLSAGQRAGLEFVSLNELVIISDRENEYSDENLDELENASIYEGVDRAIYQQGGVALTSDALRKKAAANDAFVKDEPLSKITNIFIILSAVSLGGFILSKGIQLGAMLRYNSLLPLKNALTAANSKFVALKQGMKGYEAARNEYLLASKNFGGGGEASMSRALSAMKYSRYMSYGFAVAMVVFAAITTYLAWEDMKEYYNVSFTPIPHYMVEEKDIVGYNRKGEKTVLKNQTAYYKAVECNRKTDAEFYKTLGTCADMNGDVGRQWLALYAVKNEMMDPILADSLVATVGSPDVPQGYDTGIHMFGSDAAFNLNSSLYDWNNSAKSVYVYFRVDEDAANATGSSFTGGAVALAGGAGLVLGAVATALCMTATKKKKETKAEA